MSPRNGPEIHSVLSVISSVSGSALMKWCDAGIRRRCGIRISAHFCVTAVVPGQAFTGQPTFVGDSPLTTHHRDSDKTNNALYNLCYMTLRENMAEYSKSLKPQPVFMSNRLAKLLLGGSKETVAERMTRAASVTGTFVPVSCRRQGRFRLHNIQRSLGSCVCVRPAPV